MTWMAIDWILAQLKQGQAGPSRTTQGQAMEAAGEDSVAGGWGICRRGDVQGGRGKGEGGREGNRGPQMIK